MARTWVGTWEGGRIALMSDGSRRFVLERKWQGRQYSFPLPQAGTEEQAKRSLYLWADDPQGFLERAKAKARAEKQLVVGAVYLTAEVVDELEKYMAAKSLSVKHRRNTVAYMRDWAVDLRRQDLRELGRLQLKRVLARRETAEKNRIAAFKTGMAYLRDLGYLDTGNDPGRHLTIEAPKRSQVDKGYTAKHIAAVYAGIRQPPASPRGGRPFIRAQAVRDVFRLQCCYGLHGTEVARIAAGGNTVIAVQPPGSEIAASLTFEHKAGRHTVAVDAAALAAVRRLQAAGSAPVDGVVRRFIARACTRLKLPPLNPGQLRHSLVSLGQQGRLAFPGGGQGVTTVQLGIITGHQSVGTTEKFYNYAVCPPMLVMPFQLVNADDPAIAG